MSFPKSHGLVLAANSWIENFVVERLAADPTVNEAGRIWYNSTDKVYKMTVIDTDGITVVKRVIGDKEAFDAFKTALAAQTVDGSGATLVGYDGQSGANGQFSVTAGDLSSALDAIITQIDASAQAISDIGTGNLANMQNELDAVEVASGLNADGTLPAWEEGVTYVGADTSLKGAIESLDVQAKVNADAIAANVTEIDAIETSVGVNADGTFPGFSTTNYLDSSTNLKDAIETLDLELKTITDNLAAGFNLRDQKESVRVATTENITLSGIQTIDGISLVAGDRVLVWKQTNAIENGLYVVDSGAWVRTEDADNSPTGGEVTPGMYTFVEDGTKYKGAGFNLINTTSPVLGTDELIFRQFSGLGAVEAGIGLAKDGNVINVLLGAGIKELPTDEVGLDLFTGGGLWMTADGVTEDVTTAGQLSIKLADDSLELTHAGLKVAGAATGALQTELDATQTGAGLNTDGTFSADATTNYLSAATSLKDATKLLDTQVKTNADAITQEVTDRTTAISELQTEIDAIENGAGLGVDGIYTADTNANYINDAISLFDADKKLDAQIKVNADAITALQTGGVANLQTELDATQAGAGLNTDGTFTAEATGNYIATATSLFNATVLLDTQVKSNADAIAQEIIDRGTAVSDLQTEVDAIETSVGVAADGTLAAWANSNYIASATTIKAAIEALDAQMKTYADGQASKVYTTTTDSDTTHTITHNLGTEMVSVDVWVYDATDSKYHNDIVGVTVVDTNTVTVTLTEAHVCRVIVRAA